MKAQSAVDLARMADKLQASTKNGVTLDTRV
jgi:hypothetical protein